MDCGSNIIPAELGDTPFTIEFWATPTSIDDWKQWFALGHSSDPNGTGWSTATIVQSNFWLGHSHWGDSDVASSYNEMRVWAAALSQTQVEANGRLGADTLPVFTDRCSLGMAKNVEIASGATLDLTGAELVVTNPEALQKGFTFATAPSGGIVPAAPRPLSGDLRGYRLFLSRTKARIGKPGFTFIVR